ncbi:MAG: hypothetical protein UT63_C0007G0024 [Candidatus Gottesmanbacteria bacterium GW2011_GWC2_39_8]|uniref:TrpR like protein, YerC/YecD n=1 Tax=Candidatus Gottesmanbacteria bacterium GW2011_GWC2_39_8 TaxID=1618450 RepID=A0A0G0Q131_9BACT|nr:MAG: hypothetical protein UT63_C0007G0024 [Candidatus Gottesmanbacteria bacterium GW2011_GWC2_39_8]
MPQISKRFIQAKAQEKILHLFISSIVECSNNQEALELVEDLLTPTEKVMIAKRFSIAYMLLSGYDYDSIGETLKVSRTTIGHVALWLKIRGSGMRKILAKIKSNESRNKILDDIKDSFEELLLSSRGQKWSNSKRILWERRRDRLKPF